MKPYCNCDCVDFGNCNIISSFVKFLATLTEEFMDNNQTRLAWPLFKGSVSVTPLDSVQYCFSYTPHDSVQYIYLNSFYTHCNDYTSPAKLHSALAQYYQSILRKLCQQRVRKTRQGRFFKGTVQYILPF